MSTVTFPPAGIRAAADGHAVTTGRGSVAPAARGSLHADSPGGGRRFGLVSAAETYLAIGVVIVVSLLIVPLPPLALDFLLALSFALALTVLLVVLAVNDPLEFNIFPSLLLLITLFRLGLNVSSTRLILSTGEAGQVIAAFGNFVIGGNFVVGLVIFLILVVINFVVITKGVRAHRRGRRPLHPGRHAGAADEHRRRPRRRPHRRNGGPVAGARRSTTMPTSTAPWTAPPSSCAATPLPGS